MQIYNSSTAPIKSIKKLGKQLGLDKIVYDQAYDLVEIDPPAHFLTLKAGYFSVVGIKDPQQGAIVLMLVGSSDTDWFRTSPILSCTETDDGYIIETENAIYKLFKL